MMMLYCALMFLLLANFGLVVLSGMLLKDQHPDDAGVVRGNDDQVLRMASSEYEVGADGQLLLRVQASSSSSSASASRRSRRSLRTDKSLRRRNLQAGNLAGNLAGTSNIDTAMADALVTVSPSVVTTGQIPDALVAIASPPIISNAGMDAVTTNGAVAAAGMAISPEDAARSIDPYNLKLFQAFEYGPSQRANDIQTL